MAIDLLHAFENAPKPLDFIWPGFLAGTVGALVAPGGTGKSFWTLEAAMAIACGVAGGDLLDLRPESTGPVLYLAGDDPGLVLEHRVNSIGKYLPQDAREAIAERLTLEPVMGKRLDVMHKDHMAWLLRAATGMRLVVIDTLTRIHHLDENDNGQMAQLLAQFEFICDQTGAALLFLHHTSKYAARNGDGNQQHAGRGASALIDNARWQGFLQRMTPDEARTLSARNYDGAPIGDRRDFYLRYGIGKQNYEIPQPDRWIERKDGGVLVPIVEMQDASRRGNHNRPSSRRGQLRSVAGHTEKEGTYADF